MERLLTEIRGCQICAASLAAGPRPVVQAHPDARILIAGQAPGRRVHESGIPFDDPSGERLRSWTGLDRELFYDPHITAIIPMGFCYPGTGKSGDLPPRKECAPAWRSKLLQKMTSLQLTLAIGTYAIRYHIPASKGNVTSTVANWEEYFPGIVPLPHPSPRNVGWFKRNAWFEDELLPVLRSRISEVLGRPDPVQEILETTPDGAPPA